VTEWQQPGQANTSSYCRHRHVGPLEQTGICFANEAIQGQVDEDIGEFKYTRCVAITEHDATVTTKVAMAQGTSRRR
jgi:hypothetical protein